MRKTRKSKIVILSILGLAAVSIGSIGFATWLVGINKTEQELKVNAVVDNSENDSIYLDVVVADSKFVVAEKEAHPTKANDEIVGTRTNAGDGAIAFDNNALSFTFSTFQLSIGKGVAENKTPTGVRVSFNKTDNVGLQNWNVTDVISGARYTNKTAGIKDLGSKRVSADETDGYSYISYDKTFNLATDFTKTPNETYNVYTLKADLMKQTFSWGNFFTRETESATPVSPVNFYNSIYKSYFDNTKDDYMSGAQTFDFADKINTEISTMNGAFTSQELKIRATTIIPNI